MSDDFSRLEKVGFKKERLFKNDVRLDERSETMSEQALLMNNTLHQMDLMSWHLDKYDGVEPQGADNDEGAKSFMRMLDLDAPYAIGFVGLRRLERNGDLDRLRSGLVLMAAAEKYMVPIEAVVEMTAPDLVPSGLEMSGRQAKSDQGIDPEVSPPEKVISKGRDDQIAHASAIAPKSIER